MPFTEDLKLAVRRRAHFQCCLCKALGVEIHHIVPQAEGGPDSEENAAPLCPSCHETYGANPQKRKFIREARDFWYELCANRFGSDTSKLEEISSRLEHTASRADLESAVMKLAALLGDLRGQLQHTSNVRSLSDRASTLGHLAGLAATTFLLGGSRKAQNESVAINSLRTITVAQALFRESGKGGSLRYAVTLAELGSAGLIDSILAAGQKRNYAFRLLPSADARYEWSAVAVPVVKGDAGFASYFVDVSGIIRYSESSSPGPQDTPLNSDRP